MGSQRLCWAKPWDPKDPGSSSSATEQPRPPPGGQTRQASPWLHRPPGGAKAIRNKASLSSCMQMLPEGSLKAYGGQTATVLALPGPFQRSATVLTSPLQMDSCASGLYALAVLAVKAWAGRRNPEPQAAGSSLPLSFGSHRRTDARSYALGCSLLAHPMGWRD